MLFEYNLNLFAKPNKYIFQRKSLNIYQAIECKNEKNPEYTL